MIAGTKSLHKGTSTGVQIHYSGSHTELQNTTIRFTKNSGQGQNYVGKKEMNGQMTTNVTTKQTLEDAREIKSEELNTTSTAELTGREGLPGTIAVAVGIGLTST